MCSSGSTGTLPETPVPSVPVTIDQRGCTYGPRVVGLRLGQTLEIKNSDDLLHNVHSLSGRGNAFNIAQPMAGMVYKPKLKDLETMLRLSCDIHTWMTAFVGIVNHPYFSVTEKTARSRSAMLQLAGTRSWRGTSCTDN